MYFGGICDVIIIDNMLDTTTVQCHIVCIDIWHYDHLVVVNETPLSLNFF